MTLRTMKDPSFFLFKNTLGAKMRKGFKNFCHGDASTSTLNQHKRNDGEPSCTTAGLLVENPHLDNDDVAGSIGEGQATLKQMILQLELEEKMAARWAKLDDYGETMRRMSCVNSCDILRTARNALNQYPRFSLDGRDAMYRCSFRNMPPTGGTGSRKVRLVHHHSEGAGKIRRRHDLPTTFGGECVVWCKPGIVAKLMGLDAVPIPLYRNHHGRERLRPNHYNQETKSHA